MKHQYVILLVVKSEMYNESMKLTIFTSSFFNQNWNRKLIKVLIIVLMKIKQNLEQIWDRKVLMIICDSFFDRVEQPVDAH